MANPLSAAAHADNKISLTENEKGHTLLLQDVSNINTGSIYNYLKLSIPDFPDPILSDLENENEEENEDDDKKDAGFNALKRQLLLKDVGYNQLYNQQVYLNYQRKNLPLYLLFHSWKAHLV